MRGLNTTTSILVLLGAFNWGLMGFFQLDVVATLFNGPQSTLSRIIYILVGLAGLYQVIPFVNALTDDADEPTCANAPIMPRSDNSAQRNSEP